MGLTHEESVTSRVHTVSDLGHVFRFLAQSRERNERVRFVASPSLASPEAPGRLMEVRDGNRSCCYLERAVCVLMGAQGSLPPYMLEEIAQDNGSNFSKFIQVLEHHLGEKLATLFCVTHDLSDAHHLPAEDLRRLLGISEWDQLSPGTWQALCREAPLRLTRFRGQPGCADSFRKLIVQLTGLPTTLSERDPGHVLLPEPLRGRLGRNLVLGGHHVIGKRVRNDANRIRIDVQCTDLTTMMSLAPGGERHAQLRELAGLAAGRTLQMTLAVTLVADTIRARPLGQAGLGQGAVLGECNGLSRRHYSTTVFFQGGTHEY